MQVSAAFNAWIPGPAKPARRVQPVAAIVRYPSAGSREAHENVRETTLEGEFLRGGGFADRATAAARQALPGMLVNAARAVSAYTSVSTSTAPDTRHARRRLDLHV
ncbi:MAG: hypothetical protein OEN20_07080 [Gammaproteobacteria bacterium]|nr:hypothetical protein [Gammaproteobacteria bacterium]